MHWKMFLIVAWVTMRPALLMAEDCPIPKELDDILSCLKTNHYLVQLKTYEVANSEHLSEAMGQRPNPTFNIQTVHAGSARQTQVILSQELDLAGRLSALRNQGKLTHSMNKIQRSMTQEEIVESVLLNIHHLIHLNETLKVNREVRNSLNSVIRALKKRPVLNPDQEASFLNFNLQKAEVNNLIALLEDEEEEVLLFFFLNGGYQKEQVLKVMEDHQHPLELVSSKQGHSLNLERLGLETRWAKEEFNLQKASVWSGISIGPMYMDDKMGGPREKLFGLSLTMPIPLWQANGANKAIAKSAFSNSQKQFDLFRRKESLEKSSLLTRISKLKKTLSKLPEESELVASHKRTEKLYSQGLISSTVYLDSHRIWRDVSASKLELEEKILRLTIEYYRLSGKLNEVHL